MMDVETKKRVEARLRRAAGQVAGLERMIAEDRYCIDILTQLAAVRSALAKVGEIVLESHVHTCVADAFQSGDEQERAAKISELIEVFSRYG